MQTTIKISPAVRERLGAYAAAHGLTLGQAVDALLNDDEQRRFWANVKRQIPDDDYRREANASVEPGGVEDYMVRFEEGAR
ncbi:hypothetical protein [Promicromonospora sp. NFX87]|uniref:hypothetical protein n=1 Tax=Promicromonospora sp. NFX87 TaxID=3402691 RepID=UPI003AFA77C2